MIAHGQSLEQLLGSRVGQLRRTNSSKYAVISLPVRFPSESLKSEAKALYMSFFCGRPIPGRHLVSPIRPKAPCAAIKLSVRDFPCPHQSHFIIDYILKNLTVFMYKQLTYNYLHIGRTVWHWMYE